MFKKVLFPTDFSEVAEGILEWITSLKSLGVEEVVLIRVIDLTKIVGVTSGFNIESWIKHEEEESEKNLARLVDFLKSSGLNARYITPIPRGDPVSEIVKNAETEDVSFIVIGSKGKGFFKEILMGSVSEGVVRKSAVPVMLIKPKCFKTEDGLMKCEIQRNPFDRILFAYDLSDYSRKVIDYVKVAALVGKKDVVIVNVVEGRGDRRDALLNSARKELEEENINVKIVVRDGNPSKEIIKAAEEEDASMIMIGSRGLGFIEGMLLGSTTDSVVRHSRVPVFVFKF
jgi:nucleotide-binding universal stress UspA family protein